MADEEVTTDATHVEVEVPSETETVDAPDVDAGDTTVVVETAPATAPAVVAGGDNGIHPDVARFMVDTETRFAEHEARIDSLSSLANEAHAIATETGDIIEEAVSSVDEATDEVEAAIADAQPPSSPMQDAPPVNTPLLFRRRRRS